MASLCNSSSFSAPQATEHILQNEIRELIGINKYLHIFIETDGT